MRCACSWTTRIGSAAAASGLVRDVPGPLAAGASACRKPNTGACNRPAAHTARESALLCPSNSCLKLPALAPGLLNSVCCPRLLHRLGETPPTRATWALSTPLLSRGSTLLYDYLPLALPHNPSATAYGSWICGERCSAVSTLAGTTARPAASRRLKKEDLVVGLA